MRTWLGPCLVTLTLAGVSITAGRLVVAQTRSEGGQPSRLDELLHQRREILAKSVELKMTQYTVGECTYEAVLTARRKLHEAELDAAKTREERIEVLENQLEAEKNSTALAQDRFRRGSLDQAAVLEARAALLGVEIELHRERHEAD